MGEELKKRNIQERTTKELNHYTPHFFDHGGQGTLYYCNANSIMNLLVHLSFLLRLYNNIRKIYIAPIIICRSQITTWCFYGIILLK